MNIVIVGLGVVGGSFAMALNKVGYKNVYGIDVNEETIKKAKKLGIIKMEVQKEKTYLGRQT